MLLRHRIAVAAFTLASASGVNAYETGQSTCENVGRLAAQTVQAKRSGVPFETYLSALDQRIPREAQAERQLAANITAVVYQNELVSGMKPEDAYAVFVQDCVAGQQDDEQSASDPDEDSDQSSAQDQNERGR
jgi:hypothetical protein